MKMDEKLIEFLWDRFDSSEASELLIEIEGEKFSLKKETARQSQTAVVQAPPISYSAGADHGSLAAASQQLRSGAAGAQTDSGIYVRSPLPGTFYRAASPDDEPFVMIGSKISKGDVIGIVESMKMMNEIVSEFDGTVAEILAENGSMVGYDEKLFRLEA